MIRALIVDDEPLARSAIRTMLRRHKDAEIAGECESGAEALGAMEKLTPNLMFLDVQMPEVDGFAVLERAARPLPHVIFVTAFDQYAVRAFEVHALDYLLKPFDRERFDAALDRARQALRDPGAPEWERRVTEMLEDSRPGAERFLVRHDGRVILVPAREVEWIEAQGNYVVLHHGARTHLLRESMIHVEGRLDARQFRRVNRSAIVNLTAIAELRPGFHGDYEVALRSGERLKLTAGYRRNLEKDALGGL